jgi:ComF family protein
MPFHYARSCGAYAGALEANVLFLKSQPHLCRRLRQLLQQTFSTHQEFLQCNVVMPVPLHRDRERQRGFNQAALIARLLAKAFNLRLDCHTLERVKYTEKHGVGMDAHDRAQSVKNAFQVADADAILGVSVLIIDDVLTTGSTISEITKTLLKAGAAEVNLLTVARVIR